MNRAFLDLSVALTESRSERIPPRIRYFSHDEGARQMEEILGIPVSLLPDGKGWAGEEVTCITHAGTHMDAPWHYGPVSQDQPARTIDQVPLEWCFGPGVVLDFEKKEACTELSAGDLLEVLDDIEYVLRPGDIVLLRTGAAQFWGTDEYPERGCGLGRSATRWLTRQGVRVIGTDAWGLDIPFSAMRRHYENTGSTERVWASHFAGREREYCQLEKLCNLHLLPPHGFTVICFPVKIAAASAGWTRVVAMLEGQGQPTQNLQLCCS
jgi:kynurenine formamidase